MSLSAWEQEALDSITDGFAGSDPKLVALVTAFTRLASGEEMPVRERIGAGSWRTVRCSRCKRRHPHRGKGRRLAGRAYWRLGVKWAAPLSWLVITVTLIAIALALNHGGSRSTCTQFWVEVCANSAPAHNSRPASHETVTSQARHLKAARTPPTRSTMVRASF
jgi:hypothetical protein